MKDKLNIPVSEAARIAGPSIETMKTWVRRGFIQGYQYPPGGHWFINKESLLDFLEKHEAIERKSLSRTYGKMKMELVK